MDYRNARTVLNNATGFLKGYDYTLNPYSGCSFGCTYCCAAGGYIDRLPICQRRASFLRCGNGAVLGSLEEALAENDRVTLTGFGTFEVRPTAARKVRLMNGANAGDMVEVAASHRIAFVSGKGLTQKVRSARN